MNASFTENDYNILKSIIEKGNRTKGLSKSAGTTIEEIALKTKLSDKKIRTTLKSFIEIGFVSFGVSIVKKKTYILTPEGFNELNSLTENIFGEV